MQDKTDDSEQEALSPSLLLASQVALKAVIMADFDVTCPPTSKAARTKDKRFQISDLKSAI
jgi:hypothetical protein